MSAQETPVIEMRGIIKSFYVGTPNELEILHGIDLTIQMCIRDRICPCQLHGNH